MSRYRFIACHPITRAKIATLRPTNPKWSWAVNGSGAFTADFALPKNADLVSILRMALEPWQSAIYVQNQAGRYPWGGPVIAQSWSPAKETVSVTVIEWRTWFEALLMTPKLDMTGDLTYSWNQIDQLSIARQIAQLMTAGGAADGRPPMSVGTEVSGKLRDLVISGLDFVTAGEGVDRMATRSGGFEWSIESRPDSSDGLPRLYFAPYYPQQGGLVAGLAFKRTDRGANNLIDYGPVERNASNKRVRQWTTGAGTAPDIVYAVDSDPAIVLNKLLMKEAVENFSSVIERTTLASHARALRLFYASGKQLLTVKTTLDRPDVDSYGSGDRGSLRLEDPWLNGDSAYDLPAVRIIQKEIDYQKGEVTLTLDLDDFELPEVDTAGSV